MCRSRAKIVHDYVKKAKIKMAVKIKHGHRKVDRMCLGR